MATLAAASEHLSEERVAQVQEHIDERWDLLERLEAATSAPAGI